MAREKIKLTSYDELLGVSSDGAIEVEINKLSDFNNHPFRVVDDEAMEELVESIKNNGILTPAIVRENPDGGYELISGHRRKHACEIIGLKKMPVVVKELNDDEATIIMVESNIQREEILPSEKAFAFKMKLEALSHPGKKIADLESSAESIGSEYKISKRQIHRYIRLTELIPELLDMVDEKKLPFNTAVEISYLQKEEQQVVYGKLLDGEKINPEGLKKVRQASKELDVNKIEKLIFSESTKTKSASITLKEKKISEYFGKEYSKKDIERVIYSLLDEWKKGQG